MKERIFSPEHRTLLSLGGVVLAVWLLLAVIASQSTLWERDESRYATAAREMARSGNWLYPTFNGDLRAFQPVMAYWLMASSLQTFGPSAFSVRLPSTLAAALVCLLTGLIAREFHCSGPLAAALLGTSPLFLLNGAAATTDATLLACALLAQWVFVRAWTQGPRLWQAPLLTLAIGLAMLTKGPMGLAVPVLSIGTALALAKGRSNAGPFARTLALAALGGCLMFFAWGIPANRATGNAYWEIAIAQRLPKFLFSAMEGHGGAGLAPFLMHLPYYLAVMAIGFLPWTLYLVLVPGSFRKAPSEGDWTTGSEALRVMLFGMIVPALVMLTLMVSKLPHYILPTFPWLAILAASALGRTQEGTPTTSKRLRRIFLPLGILTLLAILALCAAPWFWPPLFVFRRAGGVLGLLGLGVLVLLGRFFWRGQVQRALKIHFAGLVALILATVFLVLPPLEQRVKSAQLLSKEIFEKLPPGCRFATWGWKEPGMHFYLGAPRIEYLMDAPALEEWLTGPPPRLLLLNETPAAPLPIPPEGFRVLGTREGIDPVRGRFLRLTALLRE